MDVVASKSEDWERDPFTAVEENGYVFGRGAEDNKYDVSMMVATLAQMRRDGFKPERTLILALTGDEETEMATTRALAQQLKGAEMVLNGDGGGGLLGPDGQPRSEEHTSELQSLMSISYAVLSLNKKQQQ